MHGSGVRVNMYVWVMNGILYPRLIYVYRWRILFLYVCSTYIYIAELFSYTHFLFLCIGGYFSDMYLEYTSDSRNACNTFILPIVIKFPSLIIYWNTNVDLPSLDQRFLNRLCKFGCEIYSSFFDMTSKVCVGWFLFLCVIVFTLDWKQAA